MENVSLFENLDDSLITHVYTDGGVVGKNPSEFGGTWAFVAVNANDEKVFARSGFHKTEGQPTTNNHTELIACIEAMEAMPKGWSGTLVSDSKVTLGRIFDGWRMKNVPIEYELRMRAAKSKLGNINGVHVDGHATKKHLEEGIGKRGNPVSKWNNVVDELCNKEKDKVTGKYVTF